MIHLEISIDWIRRVLVRAEMKYFETNYANQIEDEICDFL